MSVLERLLVSHPDGFLDVADLEKVVDPVTQYRARKLTSMRAEPKRVNRKNLMAA